MQEGYITAAEASEILGVRRSTIYAYVSRKGVRSRAVAGSRQHLYWRADVEALRTRAAPGEGQMRGEGGSAITLVGGRGLFYRGRSAFDLARTETFETVAALLWQVDEDVFAGAPPRPSPRFAELDSLLHAEAGVDRALAHFAFLEHANPRAYDLSPAGMAATGVDIVRWLAAIILNLPEASAEPVHLQFRNALSLTPELTELLRRLLVLAADHGLNEETVAVRAIAATGVTPWRAVAAGLGMATGRHSRFGQNDALRRFVAEVIGLDDPAAALVRRLKEGGDVPGFGSVIYPEGDPRAAALLAFCDEALGDHPAFRRLRQVVDAARAVRDLRPNFALVSTFAEEALGLQSRRDLMGLSSSEAPYLVGRAAGWVAHCIEECASARQRTRDRRYGGILPAGDV